MPTAPSAAEVDQFLAKLTEHEEIVQADSAKATKGGTSTPTSTGSRGRVSTPSDSSVKETLDQLI